MTDISPNLRVCILQTAWGSQTESFVEQHADDLAPCLYLAGLPIPVYRKDGSAIWERASRPMRWVWRARGWCADACEEERMAAALESAIRESAPDVVLAEHGPAGVGSMDACRANGIPLVVHFHGADAYRESILSAYGPRYPELFETAAELIAVSGDMVEQLCSLGADPNKISLCPYGVDTRLFEPGDLGKSSSRFLSIGRFVDKKAPLVTLLAFSRVHARCPDSRLTMAGDGPYLSACRQLARALGVVDAVEFTGALDHAEVATLMSGARCFVQHSVRAPDNDCEGTPVAILEAMATGLPIVATSHAGIADAVSHGESGYLVDEWDAQGMADYMFRLAEDVPLAVKLGQQGRRRVREMYSREAARERLVTVLNRAVSTNGARPFGAASR